MPTTVTLKRKDGQTMQVDMAALPPDELREVQDSLMRGSVKLVEPPREANFLDRLMSGGVGAATGAAGGGPVGAAIGGGLGLAFPNTKPEEYIGQLLGAGVGGQLTQKLLQAAPMQDTLKRVFMGAGANAIGSNATTAGQELAGAGIEDRPVNPENAFINPGTAMGAINYALPFAGSLVAEGLAARKVANHPAQKGIQVTRELLGENAFPGQTGTASQTIAGTMGDVQEAAQNLPSNRLKAAIEKDRARLTEIESSLVNKGEQLKKATGIKRVAIRQEIEELRDHAENLYQKDQAFEKGLFTKKQVLDSRKAERAIEKNVETQSLVTEKNTNSGDIAQLRAEKSQLNRERARVKQEARSQDPDVQVEAERRGAWIEQRLDDIDQRIGDKLQESANVSTEISQLGTKESNVQAAAQGGLRRDKVTGKMRSGTAAEVFEMEAQRATNLQELNTVERKISEVRRKLNSSGQVARDAMQISAAEEVAQKNRLRLEIADKQKQLQNAPVVESRVRQLFDTQDPESFVSRLVSPQTNAEDYKFIMREFKDNPAAQDNIRKAALQKVFEGSYDPKTGTLSGIDKFWSSEPGKVAAFGEDKLNALYPGDDQVVPKFKELIRTMQESAKPKGFMEKAQGVINHAITFAPYYILLWGASPEKMAVKVAAGLPVVAAIKWSNFVDSAMRDPKLYDQIMDFARTGIQGIQASQHPRMAQFLQEQSIRMSARQVEQMNAIANQTAEFEKNRPQPQTPSEGMPASPPEGQQPVSPVGQ
jgi:hypothetical protein